MRMTFTLPSAQFVKHAGAMKNAKWPLRAAAGYPPSQASSIGGENA